MSELATAPRDRLLESLRADQVERWHGGERRLVETYLASVPDLRGDDDAVLDLIYNEVVVRDELGEEPAPEEYLHRFPHLDAALRRQFTVHRLLASSALRAASDTSGSRQAPSTDVFAGDTHPEPAGEPADWPSVPGYEVLEEVGRGGMGVVYKARQTKLNRVVALKLIRSPAAEVSARFHTEAKTAARLQHPNIVQIHECGDSASGPYVALEYVDGGSLARKIDGTPLLPREAAELLLPLARAMHYAHGQGVVHRDLKPANVLLVSGGVVSGEWSSPTTHHSQLTTHQPKITDFGLAKYVDADSGQTKSGAVLGTPSYMAPEQASGHSREVGPAADVYALGAILYECLTGRPPFKAATAMETMQQVVHEDPVPPRRLLSATPRDLETICLKCLRKEPRKRYLSAEELARDLERYVGGVPIRARPVSGWERTVKWTIRHPAAAVLLVLTAAAVTAALVLWATFTKELATFTRQLETEKTEARKQEKIATDLKQMYEKERDYAWSQRDEAVLLLEANVAAVRDHAKVVGRGKAAEIETANPGEVLFRLACAYARSSRTFRNDKSLAPEHAGRLADEYADGAMTLLKAAQQIGFFDNPENCNRLRLEKEDLQPLADRSDFKQLGLPKGRGVLPKP
jgi:hypothetical protein